MTIGVAHQNRPTFKELRMIRMLVGAVVISAFVLGAAAQDQPAAKKLAKGDQAPTFRIKGATGKTIDLAELTGKGPVLVRLTCGCSGCDKELTYFQQISDAYKSQGLTSVFIF